MSIVRLVPPSDYLDLPPEREARLQGDVNVVDYNFVFKGVLAGHRGAQIAILGQLFKKFCNELRNPANAIPPHYDDDNERKVIEILERCTFGSVGQTAAPRNVRGRTKKVSGSKPDGSNVGADVSGKGARGKRQDRQEATQENSSGPR